MSKSLGNFFTVRDLLDQGIPGEVIRFVMLSTHYRKPMDWTEKKRGEAEGALRGWRQLTQQVKAGNVDARVIEALSDDLNTAGVFSVLHDLAKKAVLGEKDASSDLLASAQFVGLLTDELGGWDKVSVDLSDLAEKLAAVRATAMETKDFSAVDAMKKALIEAGVEVRMSKAGVELVPGAGFDASKLENIT